MRGRLTVLALVLGACSSERAEPKASTPDAGATPTLPELRSEACARWAEAYCPAYETCRPFVYQTQYPDGAECVKIETERCVRERFLPGTGWTPQAIDACVAALDWKSCAQVLAHDTERSPIPECAPPGTLPDGTSCMRAMQCQGGACVRSGGALCGQCAPAVPHGGACTDSSECGPPLATCHQGKCWLKGDEGAACPSTWACKQHLSCVFGKCGPRIALGEPCGSSSFTCQDFPVALWCNEQTGLCSEVVFMSEGGQCPTLDDGRMARCKAPFGCKWIDAAAKKGECRPQASLGEACGQGWGYSNQCRYPLQCAGTCIELSAEYCNPQVLPP